MPTATSGVGGAVNVTGPNVQVGDQASNGQAKAILSFDTSVIPDSATVVSATLRLQRVGVLGTNPFNNLGRCRIDLQSGAFGGNPALEVSDFQAFATVPAAGTLSNAVQDGAVSSGSIGAMWLATINKTGRTQMRLSFDVHDNGNGIADRILYGSGEQTDPTVRPELQITYMP